MTPELHQLSNGIRVIVDPMPSLETVAFGVWAKAGSVDEGEDEAGIAHLLEHMAFKGTSSRSAKEIAEEIESVGGYLNAATSHQRTGYYARILKADLPLAIDIIADILTQPSFAEAELVKEREVVVQEIGEAFDTPDDVVFEKLLGVIWAGEPLSRPILGTAESVRSHTPEKLTAFMQRLYGAENLVIAVSGSIKSETAIPLLEKAFGSVASGAGVNHRGQVRFQGGTYHDNRKIEQTHVALGFPGFATTDKRYFAMRLYTDILGGGMSSRLFQRIREQEGLAYTVYAFADGFEQCGLAGAYFSADAQDVMRSIEIIKGEMQNLTKHVDQSELDRARALLKSSLLMGLESPANRIEATSGQLHTYGHLLSPTEIVEKLEAVTIDDVINCARYVLDGEVAVSMVGPGNVDDIARSLTHPST